MDKNALHYLCLGCANTSFASLWLCLFANVVGGHWSVPISVTCLHFFPPPSLGPRRRESVSVSIPAACVGDHSLMSHRQESHKAKWRLHPCLHLEPPPLQSLFPTLILCHPSLSPPTASSCTYTLPRSQTHTSFRPFLQTDANRLLVLLVSLGVSFEINLYTSAPELTSIWLNSFNSHDICLLAYLLSKQAEAQLASWETVTLAFVTDGEENVIACAKYKLQVEYSILVGMDTHILKSKPIVHKHAFIVSHRLTNSSQGLYLTQLHMLRLEKQGQ